MYRNLNSNPVECDCALRWLPTFLESRSSLLLSGTCANLNGAAINSLTEDQLICGESCQLIGIRCAQLEIITMTLFVCACYLILQLYTCIQFIYLYCRLCAYLCKWDMQLNSGHL